MNIHELMKKILTNGLKQGDAVARKINLIPGWQFVTTIAGGYGMYELGHKLMLGDANKKRADELEKDQIKSREELAEYSKKLRELDKRASESAAEIERLNKRLEIIMMEAEQKKKAEKLKDSIEFDKEEDIPTGEGTDVLTKIWRKIFPPKPEPVQEKKQNDPLSGEEEIALKKALKTIQKRTKPDPISEQESLSELDDMMPIAPSIKSGTGKLRRSQSTPPRTNTYKTKKN